MDFILNGVRNFLTKPLGYYDCDSGFIPGTKGSPAEGNCYPDLITNVALSDLYKNGILRLANKDANVEDYIWQRYNRPAPIYSIASANDCEPNTVSFNGSCFQGCQSGKEQRTFEEGGKKQVECRASCNADGWHYLNWGKNVASKEGLDIFQPGAISWRKANANDNPFVQLDAPRDDWCYHIPTDDTTTNTPGYDSRWPIGVVTFTGKAGDIVGQASNTVKIKFDGVYGERMNSFLGLPKMAGNCPPPNVATDAQCLKPAPAGFEVQGNEWVTKTPCPAAYSTKSTMEPNNCIPTPVYRKKYGSLLDYIMILVVIILVVIVLIKFARR